MILFRYLQEKDMFEAFYKRHLSKRLLLGKSASYELEKSMLSKLKTECGSGFTAKLEGMFQDVDLSRECQIAFQSQSSNRTGSSSSGSSGTLDMQVQVLTTGFWPTPAAVHTTSKAGDGGRIVLPLELRLWMEKFETFYANKYQGRRLLWAHSLERCIVAARFPKGKKDLEVSLFQALILKCFNKADKISFCEIA
jgi:cullin-4